MVNNMTEMNKQADEELEILVIKAGELAALIRSNEITREYEESLKRVQQHRTAMEII